MMTDTQTDLQTDTWTDPQTDAVTETVIQIDTAQDKAVPAKAGMLVPGIVNRAGGNTRAGPNGLW